jgi:hypothetical protein
MMRKACVTGTLALLLVLGVVEAGAQTIRDFPCQIDLAETDDAGNFVIDPQGLAVPPGFRRSFGTSGQQKVCQGKKNVRVTCDALIPDWPFKKNFAASDFTCLINAEACGITAEQNEEGLAEAANASLKIVSTKSSLCGADASSCGFATLECRLR